MTHRIASQATAFALAALMTLAILGGVDGIATSEPPAQLVAHVMQQASAPV